MWTVRVASVESVQAVAVQAAVDNPYNSTKRSAEMSAGTGRRFGREKVSSRLLVSKGELFENVLITEELDAARLVTYDRSRNGPMEWKSQWHLLLVANFLSTRNFGAVQILSHGRNEPLTADHQ